MNLNSALELIKDEFEPIFISGFEQIKENGLYLIFDGLESIAPLKDRAKFALVLSANSLNSDNFAVVRELDRIRFRLFNLSCKFGQSWYKQTKAARFESSTLFIYAILFEIEIDLRS